MTCLLDTGVWLRAARNPGTIPAEIRRRLDDPSEAFGLSVFSFWEIAKKHQKGKLTLPMDPPAWFRMAVMDHLQVFPVTAEAIIESTRLSDLPVNDPADKLIVAAARVHRLTLLATDTKLKDCRHARIRYFTPVVKRV